ncbi:MAG: SAM-dependent methyltransferase [endosymbiont of Seepiophila jonesi]|uniref:SAM-dependent methyltransferase n=1 Tax=endosymbiont of Lamellibrachia luymesi TaxID=2200907 RepID=A0A370DRY2_9GAMM|nr:MAG: SAM-dependent methyltransferase [endosymbiont of Lamellibrachia luymesi]RDH89824.1 MAG: SAM-dependent methyltransferase [endosymbiont of Seepiophila jonesi]
MAESADRHHLYELSVQCAESEIDFVDDAYKKLRGHRAKLLREDFCGTANVCSEWVRRRKTNRAIGVDLDKEVLDWGKTHQIGQLKASKAKRIELILDNVLTVQTEAPDIISAMNFSYWLFKERDQLKGYFKQVHKQLAEGGILFMDAYGGYDSFRDIVEEREIEDGNSSFTYIWEQEKYDPISGTLICHIHFDFPDDSRLEKAFSYNWRLWTLPEIRELLDEAGFSKVTFYWQGFDEEGEADGIFEPVEEGEADAGWIAYITAEK